MLEFDLEIQLFKLFYRFRIKKKTFVFLQSGIALKFCNFNKTQKCALHQRVQCIEVNHFIRPKLMIIRNLFAFHFQFQIKVANKI